MARRRNAFLRRFRSILSASTADRAADRRPEPTANAELQIAGNELIKYRGRGGDVTIPPGIVKIGIGAFENCADLTCVSIPQGVVEIGDNAFSGCGGLRTISIPQGVVRIGDSAFERCAGLRTVLIPQGVVEIGSRAFKDCRALRAVSVPDSVTEVGVETFCGTAWIRSRRRGPVYLGRIFYRFQECAPNLTGYTIRPGTSAIAGGAFQGCEQLLTVSIPSSVVAIGPHAFRGCKSLFGVTIPDGVTRIEEIGRAHV